MTPDEWKERIHGETNKKLRIRLAEVLRAFAAVIEDFDAEPNMDARLSAVNISRILVNEPELTTDEIRELIENTPEEELLEEKDKGDLPTI